MQLRYPSRSCPPAHCHDAPQQAHACACPRRLVPLTPSAVLKRAGGVDCRMGLDLGRHEITSCKKKT